MAMRKNSPRGSSKMAKPVKGSKPKTPHDGSVFQAGGALGGKAVSEMVMPREGKVGAATSMSKPGRSC
jgi:hypothetical protein